MFEWDEFLNLAKSLIENSEIRVSEESKARTSISRSYYSVYHLARRFLEEQGEIKKWSRIGDSHIYVIRQFRVNGSNRICKIGNNLGILWDKRKKADYEQETPISMREAESSLKLAEYLRRTLLDELDLLRRKRGR